jgi:hypothetical protein
MVRATDSAINTPSPTTRPMVLRNTTEVKASARKEIITVAPLVAMLSPAHATEVSIACWTDAPFTLSSL